MADISGTSLKLTSSFSPTGPGQIDFATTLGSHVLDGVTYVYVQDPFNNKVGVLSLGEDGVLTYLGQVEDTPGLVVESAADYLTFDANGTSYLMTAGGLEAGVTIFELSGTAPYLTFVDSVFDTDSSQNVLLNTRTLRLDEVGNATVIYVASSEGITVFLLESDGGLTTIGSHALTAETSAGSEDFRALDMDIVKVADETLVVVSGGLNAIASIPNAGGVQIYQLDPYYGGTYLGPPRFETISTGAGLYTDMATKVVGDLVYIYLFDSESGRLSVNQFDNSAAAGSSDAFVELQSFRINLGESLFFSPFNGLDIVEVEGRSLLTFNSNAIGEISVYEINTDPFSFEPGSLTLLERVPQNDVHYSETITVNGTRYLVTSNEGNSDLLSVFEVGGGDDVLDGTRDADTIRGFGGNDIITALDGDDTVEAGDGDDIVTTGSGDDIVFGEEGDDTITLGAGDDFADPGAGDDVVNGGAGADLVLLSTGQDTLYGGSDIDTLSASNFVSTGTGITIDFIRNQVILDDGTVQFVSGFENANGTALNDTLVGTDGDNVIQGGEGDDLIRGRSGDDTLSGNGGNDQLVGANGDDDLRGGIGDDRISGGNGDDVMEGGADADRMYGGSGIDRMNGGAGDDLLKGNTDNDDIGGGSGNDRIEGNQGDDFLRGNAGNDVIIGGGGRDRLNGGADNDTLTGGSAADEFVFLQTQNGGGGFNVITDFQDGLDKIDISDYALASLIPGTAVQFFGDVRINIADGQTIVIQNFQLADLDNSDFIL